MSATIYAARICGSYILAALAQAPGVANLDALIERATQETDGTQAVGVALGVSSDYLLDGATDEAAKARFADRELLQQFQEVEQLPDEDKNVVKKLLDAFLTKKHLQALAR